MNDLLSKIREAGYEASELTVLGQKYVIVEKEKSPKLEALLQKVSSAQPELHEAKKDNVKTFADLCRVSDCTDAGKTAESDIDLVQAQTGVDYHEAQQALKRSQGDIVNAIMELTQ